MDFSDILIDFWGHFSGGSKMAFSDFKMHFWGSGFRGSVGGPGVCNSSEELLFAERKGVHRGKNSVVDMVSLVFMGFHVYHQPGISFFFSRLEKSIKIPSFSKSLHASNYYFQII